jgi:predicted small secreted protein
MSRIFAWSTVAILNALLLAGCNKQEGVSTEVMEQTYAIESTARLTIKNLNGSISIRGADAPELKLRATKKASSAAQLQDINIRVAAETGSVSITTTVVPQKKKGPLGEIGAVDYELIVPRTARIARVELEDGKVLIEGMEGEDVRANVVDGQLTVRNCCANLHVTIASGDLDLSYDRCGPRPFFAEAQVTHGTARVSLPRDASIRARAQTTKGKVFNDFADIVDVNSRSLQKVDLSLGSSARSDLAVYVTTGDIRLVALKSNPVAASQTARVADSQ